MPFCGNVNCNEARKVQHIGVILSLNISSLVEKLMNTNLCGSVSFLCQTVRDFCIAPSQMSIVESRESFASRNLKTPS